MPSSSHSARATWTTPSGRAHSMSMASPGGSPLREVDAARHTRLMLWARRSSAARSKVGAAKVGDDVGGGAPLGRVPARLGELVVLHGGTVFVVAFGRAQIHAYTIGVLQRSVKRFLYIRVYLWWQNRRSLLIVLVLPS